MFVRRRRWNSLKLLLWFLFQQAQAFTLVESWPVRVNEYNRGFNANYPTSAPIRKKPQAGREPIRANLDNGTCLGARSRTRRGGASSGSGFRSRIGSAAVVQHQSRPLAFKEEILTSKHVSGVLII